MDLELQEAQLAEALSFVDEIPDQVVRNSTDRELAAYIEAKGGAPTITYRANVLGCTAAITAMIAGAALPAFKVVKVVKIVKKLGGARKTAEALKRQGGLKKVAGKKANESNVNGLLASLAAELSGYSSVREHCF